MTRAKAYIALMSFLIITTVVGIFLVSSQIITSKGLQGTLADQLGGEARLIAESCLDDTLILLRSDSSYAGGNLNLSNGLCTITVSDTGPNTKDITVVGSIQNTYFQTIVASIQITETADTKLIELLTKTFQ